MYFLKFSISMNLNLVFYNLYVQHLLFYFSSLYNHTELYTLSIDWDIPSYIVASNEIKNGYYQMKPVGIKDYCCICII